MQSLFSWEMLYVLGTVVLAVGLVYGVYSYYTRNRRNDALTEDATRAQYDHSTVEGAHAATAPIKAQVRKS